MFAYDPEPLISVQVRELDQIEEVRLLVEHAADHHEIGSLGDAMCRYGSVFCDNPSYVFVGAVLGLQLAAAAHWWRYIASMIPRPVMRVISRISVISRGLFT